MQRQVEHSGGFPDGQKLFRRHSQEQNKLLGTTQSNNSFPEIPLGFAQPLRRIDVEWLDSHDDQGISHGVQPVDH
jgi:hypothetical protein